MNRPAVTVGFVGWVAAARIAAGQDAAFRSSHASRVLRLIAASQAAAAASRALGRPVVAEILADKTFRFQPLSES